MSPESADDALTKVRARLFLIFLKRLHVLHRNRPAPESFYIGQDYVEDHARVDCTIAVNFLCPGQVKQFEFWQRGTKVNGTQFENVLLVRAYRKISIQLWDDLRLKGVGQQFVIGYVKTLLPSINRRLIENRYSLGHPLSRTFAIFEAMDVSVTVNDRRIWLSWPISIPLFPPSAQLSNDVTVLYIRDYIDAIHAFFRSEYDDCIRRVITATESFLETKKWKAKRSYREYLIDIINKAFGFRRNNSHSLRRRLSDNLCKKLISNLVINENLQYVYKIRNKIVHDGYRMSTTSWMFCDKAVCSVYYLIFRHSGDRLLSEYAFTLHQQFTIIKNVLGEMYDLDEIERKHRKQQALVKPIDSDVELEDWMFNALRFTEEDKRSI